MAEEPEEVQEQGRIAAALALKNEVPKLRSVSSMVRRRRAPQGQQQQEGRHQIDQANSGMRCKVMPGARMLKMW